jgi:hypothetical protein
MTEFDIEPNDPTFKATVFVFVVGFVVNHLVDFHQAVEVILDVVLVGVGLVSIIKGTIHIVEKMQEWKKNNKLKKSRQ